MSETESSPIGGYIHRRKGDLLCVHCIDHTRKDTLYFPIGKHEVKPTMRCVKCKRTLNMAMKKGPIKDGN